MEKRIADRGSRIGQSAQRLLAGCIVGTLTLLAGGCVTKAPPAAPDMRKQALPNVNLDRQWKAAGAAAPDTVQDEWLKTFNDPELDALVREALANNPDLRIAAARVEQSAQQLVIAKAGLKPSVGIAGTGRTKSGGGSDPTAALQGHVASAAVELDRMGPVR